MMKAKIHIKRSFRVTVAPSPTFGTVQADTVTQKEDFSLLSRLRCLTILLPQ